MSLAARLILCAVVLGGGVAAHVALVAHLGAGSEGGFASLRAPLSAFPKELRLAGEPPLRGQEHPGRADAIRQTPFADDLLYRVYQQASGQGAFLLYAAYSARGEDRKHHPEVCLREAAGTPEDFSARKPVPLREDGLAPAQRFRFRAGASGYMNLYYWHYTLPAKGIQKQTGLQALHQRLIAAAPSITFQAISYATGDELARFEAGVLPAIDAAIRAEILPEGATVGSDRIPVTFLRR